MGHGCERAREGMFRFIFHPVPRPPTETAPADNIYVKMQLKSAHRRPRATVKLLASTAATVWGGMSKKMGGKKARHQRRRSSYSRKKKHTHKECGGDGKQITEKRQPGHVGIV